MSRRATRVRPDRGVVLVVVIGLLSLLTVLVLSLNTLVRLEVQVEGNRAAQVRARAQARAALEIAMGQLQRYAGRDACATAAAGEASANPGWIGVWDEAPGSGGPMVWLVSGNEIDPLDRTPSLSLPDPDDAGSDTVWLLNRNIPDECEQWRVKLTPVDVRARHPGQAGRVVVSRFAYWIGDESHKLSLGEPDPNAALPPDFPRPRLDLVLELNPPPADVRARLLFVDQAAAAGFDRRWVREHWMEVTAQAWRVAEEADGAHLWPMAFNVNSTTGTETWRAVLAPGEAALPAEVRDDPVAIETFHQRLFEAAWSQPRPIKNLAAFRDATATAFPTEADQVAFWSRLEPVLTVRGDTFLIRAYGEALNPARADADHPEARAWLEALVQRTAEPHPDAHLGRRFRIRWLRWLSADEV